MTEVLARRDRALTPEEAEQLLRDRLGDHVVGSTLEYGTFTVQIASEGWADVARTCRDEPLLAYDLFDCLFGIDAREEGFDVVAVLYSTSTGNRICLRTRCPGGRENPACPSMSDVYRGANWMERETWDMFGIEFEGHPGLEPRLLTAENFEGWPLRKDFYLATREAKPWPGVKEPAELDEEGNVIERVPGPGDAAGPTELDKAMAEQAKRANPQPEPVTVEGENIEQQAQEAETAEDTGAVVAGDVEKEAELAEAEADEVAAETAGEETDAAAEQARTRAEEKRKAQAEARARKAAERTEAAESEGDAEATESGGGAEVTEAGDAEATGEADTDGDTASGDDREGGA